MAELTPRQIVRELDRYIVGQDEAKRAVAIALRNRYRRSKVDDAMREEISPKNILMIGPTGVGKTEIARRLAKLVSAPFIKVEATKFTEVGYVGRDVESIVRDLVENAIRMVREEHTARVAPRARVIAEDRLVTLLVNPPKKPSNSFSLDYLLGRAKSPETPAKEENAELADERERLRQQLMKGEIEDRELEIEVEEAAPSLEVGGSAISLGDMMGNMMPKKTKLRRVKVKEARKILEQEEADKLIDQDAVQEEAIRRAEQDGIVFIDEIDKIAGRRGGSGPDVSREGVQRDILPIVEGSTVNTKYGPVKTDIPCGEGQRPDSGTAGALPGACAAEESDARGLPADSDAAGQRADAAIQGAAGGGQGDADVRGQRHRGDCGRGVHGERDGGRHRRAPPARRVRAGAGGHFLQRG